MGGSTGLFWELGIFWLHLEPPLFLGIFLSTKDVKRNEFQIPKEACEPVEESLPAVASSPG